jgi:hypothetical protein
MEWLTVAQLTGVASGLRRGLVRCKAWPECNELSGGEEGDCFLAVAYASIVFKSF